MTTTRPFIIAGALIHFRRMTALVPGRTRLRRYIVADSASDEDELNSRLETLAVADSPPTRPPASARRGGLDGDAWARVARRDATAALKMASDDENGWLATSDEEGQGASASESASNSDSILDLTEAASPEAAAMGGLALLETGDRVRMDLNKGEVNVLISDEELAARRAKLEAAGGYPYPASQTPWQEIQRSVVGQMNTGAILEGAEKYQRIAQTKGLPRDNH